MGKLDELLELFIKKYVQCHQCGNPETRIKIRRDNIHLMCKACGNKSDVDMRHRLNVYILKNPPEEKVSKAEKRCAFSPDNITAFRTRYPQQLLRIHPEKVKA